MQHQLVDGLLGASVPPSSPSGARKSPSRRQPSAATPAEGGPVSGRTSRSEVRDHATDQQATHLCRRAARGLQSHRAARQRERVSISPATLGATRPRAASLRTNLSSGYPPLRVPL